MNLLKKEEILKKANDGCLESVLEYLHLTEGEQFLTNEERDFIYWFALTNSFNKNLIEFEDYKEKKDYFGLINIVNSLIRTYGLMKAFVEEDVNGYFSAEEDDPEVDEKGINLKKVIDEGDYSLMEQDVLNYKGVRNIVGIRRHELIDVLSEFILLNKNIICELTLPAKRGSNQIFR